MKNMLRKVKYMCICGIYYIPMLFYKKNTYNIYSDETTVDKIINESLSLCRYGDGEFKWMLGIKQKSFQNDDKELRRKLLEIFSDSPNSKVLISIPSMLNDYNNLTVLAKGYWMKFIFKYHKKWEKILPSNIYYSNSNITRPYMDYK